MDANAVSTPLFLTSRLLRAAGVAHGFSLRGGGVSGGQFSSLNLSVAVGDEGAAVEENLARLRSAAGLAGGTVVAGFQQVHGDRVLAARASEGQHLVELFPPSEAQALPVSGESLGQPGSACADALLALEPGTAVAVAVAGCAPVLIAVADEGAAAAVESGRSGARAPAVHSRWRGSRLSIAARAVRALQRAAGAEPSRMLAAVGPCIGRCC